MIENVSTKLYKVPKNALCMYEICFFVSRSRRTLRLMDLETREYLPIRMDITRFDEAYNKIYHEYYFFPNQ